MGIYDDIEDGVRGMLNDLREGEAPLFAAVAGGAGDDWRRHLAALEALAAPAALVAVNGRPRAGTDEGIPAGLRVLVFVAARGLRSAEAARRGDVDTRGAWLLAERAETALDGAVVARTHRLAAVDEDVLTADERKVVVVMRFLAQRVTTATAPTLDGAAVAGAGSSVAVQAAAHEARLGLFAFPGVDGVFQQGASAVPRTLVWSGTLRAADHPELNAIEAGLERLVGDGVGRPVNDGLGRTFPNCVATAFLRRGPRRIHPLTGAAVQNFELRFLQLGE